MRAHTLLMLAAFSLVGVGLSGCLEAPAFLAQSDVEATALQNRDIADAAARGWNPDAVLVSVVGFESANETRFKVPADPEVGNGRAPVWIYAYAAGSATRAFHVSADGSVVPQDETNVSGEYAAMAVPLTGWSVDSDAAMGAAMADETFAAAARGEDASLIEGVASIDGDLGYYLVAMSKAGLVYALVDAKTGELKDVRAIQFDFGFGMPMMDPMAWSSPGPMVVIEDEGTLDGMGGKKEYPFTLPASAIGELSLDIDRRLPSDGVWWAVLDADGEAVSEGYAGTFGGDEVEETFELDAGEYTLVLRYSSGVWLPNPVGAVDYDLSFVAGGFDMDFDWDWDAPA